MHGPLRLLPTFLGVLLAFAGSARAQGGDPTLTVEKRLERPATGGFQAGGTAVWLLDVTYGGPGSSGALEFFDPLAEGLSLEGLESADGTPIVLDAVDPLRWTTASLGAGETLRLVLTTRIDADLAPGTVVSNQFAVRRLEVPNGALTQSDDPNTPARSDPTLFVLGAGAPDLGAFRKTVSVVGAASDRAQIGDTLLWTLRVRNGGDAEARNVALTDPLSARTAFEAGSLTLDGTPLTDRADADAGDVLDGRVSVRLDTIAPGATRIVTFRSRVTAGPEVTNQARLFASGLPFEDSDADDLEEDGDAPTRVTVGDAPARALEGTASVGTPTGGPAGPGSVIRLRVELVNRGNVVLDAAQAEIRAPVGIETPTATSTPAGSRFVVSADGSTWRVEGFGLAPGASAIVEVGALVGPGPPTRCFEVEVAAAGVAPQRLTPPCLDTTARPGTLSGRVFEDANGNGRFDDGEPALSALSVEAAPTGAPSGGAARRATTGGDGQFDLEAVPPGELDLEVSTAAGTVLERRTWAGARGERLEVAVRPMGRVWDTGSGALLDGVRVRVARVAGGVARPVDPADLDDPSQADQTTSNGGLYHVVFRRAGTYTLVLDALDGRHVFPSVVRPPVSPPPPADGRSLNPRPWPFADTPTPWTATLVVQNTPGRLSGNNIPLDPQSSLVRLSGRALRSRVLPGGIASFELDLVSTSPRDQRFDPVTGRGGVYVVAEPHDALAYVAGSATWYRVREGRESPFGAWEPTSGRPLRFGVVEARDGRRSVRPLDLRAGEALRLRWQMSVRADQSPVARVGLGLRAVQWDEAPLTDRVSVGVAIDADPVFDRGFALGRVFCDEDGDGQPGPRENGLPGVRVGTDRGAFVTTDLDGRFHLEGLDAGAHAFALDVTTLPPEARTTTPERVVRTLTRGLPTRVEFGTTCPLERIAQRPANAPTPPVAAARPRVLVLSGNARALRLESGAVQWHGDAPGLRLWRTTGGGSAQVSQTSGVVSPNAEELSVELLVPASHAVRRWAVWLSGWSAGGASEEVLWAEGFDTPPVRLPWAAARPEARSLAERSERIALRWNLTSAAGLEIGGPAEVFSSRSSARRGAAPVWVVEQPDLDAAGLPRGGLDASLETAIKAVGAQRGHLVVEVHTDDAPTPSNPLERTTLSASALAERLSRLWHGPGRTLEVIPRGAEAPRVPNLTERQRARNRRLEFSLEPSRAAVEGDAGHGPLWASAVEAGGVRTVPDERGDFSLVAPLDAAGAVEVTMRAADGRHATFALETSSDGVPRLVSARRVTLDGHPEHGLRLDGAAFVWPATVPRLETAQGALRLLERPTCTQWQVVTEDATGRVVERMGGQGSPPATLASRGPPAGGATHLACRQVDGAWLFVAPRVDAAARAIHRPPGEWQVRVEGETVLPGAAGRYAAVVAVPRGLPAWIEVTSPDGVTVVREFDVPATPASSPRWAPRLRPPSPYARMDSPAETAAAPSEPGPYGRVETTSPTPSPNPTAARPSTVVWPPATDQVDALGLRAYVPTGDATPAALVVAPAPRSPLPESARQVLAVRASRHLDTPLPSARGVAGLGHEGATPVPLEVHLPPSGAPLRGRSVPYWGLTAPGAVVTVNGLEVPVEADGRFGGAVWLTHLDPRIEVLAQTEHGASRVERSFALPASSFFLVALADGLGGGRRTIEPLAEGHTVDLGENVSVEGRGTLFLKGYARGEDVLGGLFDEYRFTAHADTARSRSTEAARRLVDLDASYPVYGDDATPFVEGQARGPLYVLIEADASRLTVGDFETSIRGLGVLRYERKLTGGHLRLERPGRAAGTYGLEAFAADQDAPERHVAVELRATGGSLYYLPRRELVEGSERVWIVVRDRSTGLERARVPLVADRDYTLRPREGRLLLHRPLAGTVGESAAGESQPGVLDGRRPALLGSADQFLAVEFDHRDPRADGSVAAGAHARERLGPVVLGGGLVQEGRTEVGVAPYRLYGGEVGLVLGEATGVGVELARSESSTGARLSSIDGGLSWRPVGPGGARGQALRLQGSVELDDLRTGTPDGPRGPNGEHWRTEVVFQRAGAGYAATGLAAQVGQEKVEASSRWQVDRAHRLALRFDQVRALDGADPAPYEAPPAQRRVVEAEHGWTRGPWSLTTRLTQTRERTDTVDAPLEVTTVAEDAAWRLDSKWTLLFGQEVVVQGDDRLHDSVADLFTSSVGARYRPDVGIELEAMERLRFSGDNATEIGLRAELDERRTAYTQQRFERVDSTERATAVVGAEERWGEDASGRSYGEYQLQVDGHGQQDGGHRAVLGLGKRTALRRGLSVDAGYERAQALGDGAARLSTDAVSAGAEWVRAGVSASTRQELRYDDLDEAFALVDTLQLLTLTSIRWRVSSAVELSGRLNATRSVALDDETTRASALEVGFGAAWRPLADDTLIVLGQWAKRYERSPIAFETDSPSTREELDVVSVTPMLELPWRLRLTEKLAWKRYALSEAALPTRTARTLLWINRLDRHVLRRLDVGAEYRFLGATLAGERAHGFLVEVAYIVEDRVRLGGGWNFTRFSDEDLARPDESHGGAFVRVTAAY